MAITLGANITSLTLQRTLRSSSEALSRSFQRLSSGSRLFSASEDAAGLAVADKLSTNARLYSAASRNLSDGISALAITDATLGSQIDILGRLSELATQSANGTLSSTQRKTLDSEFQSLIDEAGRIGDTALFNGISLLKQGRLNDFSELILQAGIDGGSNSRLTLRGIDTGSFSGVFNRDRRTADWDGDENVTLSDANQVGTSYSYTLDELRERFGGEVIISEVRDSSGNSRRIAMGLYEYMDGSITGMVFVENLTTGEFSGTTENGVKIGTEYTFGTQNGVITFNSSGQITSDSGKPTFSLSDYGLGTITFDLTGVRFLTTSELGATGGAGTNTTLMESLDIRSSAAAQDALSVLQNRLNELIGYRGQVGAVQSRVSVARDLLESSRLTSEAAASRIRDIDVAAEAAQLSRLTIIQQATTALLAQANQQPALALTLLR